MTITKFVSASLVALTLAGTGAVIVSAQEQTPRGPQAGPGVDVMPRKAHFRGHHGEGEGWMRGHGGMMRGPMGENVRMIFEEVDADGNGSVTQVEIDTYRSTKVGEVDASGDGALSIEEFDTLYRELTRSRMVDAFQRLDSDGDGVISVEEMDRRFGGIVDRMDRNDDGALSIEDRGRG